jgi:hypothetical protein
MGNTNIIAYKPETEFAKLLLEYDDTEYHFWKEAFPLIQWKH